MHQPEKAFKIFINSLYKAEHGPNHSCYNSIKPNLTQILAFPSTPLSIYINPFDPIDQAVLQTTTQQHSIGWTHFLKGRLSKGWGLAQEQYLYNPLISGETSKEDYRIQICCQSSRLDAHPPKSHMTGKKWRNQQISGPTIKEHNKREWAHKSYEKQETMVPPTERLRLFDLSLIAARLQTASRLQVLWL